MAGCAFSSAMPGSHPLPWLSGLVYRPKGFHGNASGPAMRAVSIRLMIASHALISWNRTVLAGPLSHLPAAVALDTRPTIVERSLRPSVRGLSDQRLRGLGRQAGVL
jgi:hypothetical protein